LLEFGNGDLDFNIGVAGRIVIEGIVEAKLLGVLGGLGLMVFSVPRLGFESLLLIGRFLFEGRGEGGGVGSSVLGGCGLMIVEIFMRSFMVWGSEMIMAPLCPLIECWNWFQIFIYFWPYPSREV